MNQSGQKSANEVNDFIQSLELPEIPTALKGLISTSLKLKDEQKSANVVAGGIVSFVEGLSAQQKSDVLNSTLLAQLAANKKFNREKEIKEWYDFYKNVLENVGWTLGSFSFEEFKTSDITFEMNKEIVAELVTAASALIGASAESAIKAVQNLKGDEKAFKIYSSTTHSTTGGNFGVTPCQVRDGNIVMQFGAYRFTAKNVDNQFLWHKWTKDSLEFYKGFQRCILNEDVYGKVRKAIIDKLGDNATAFIADLDI
jgi:hypothetical protein